MERTITEKLDRNMSLLIKGLALISMLALHIFAETSWRTEVNIRYSNNFEEISRVFKICVSMFAFITGWGYWYSKSKTISYGITKIINLLIGYWIQLFFIFIPIKIIATGEGANVKTIIVNMFGLGPNINIAAWYVYFYIFTMLTLPFIVKILKYNFIINILIIVIGSWVIEICVHSLSEFTQIMILKNIFWCFMYLPCVIIGYLCAKHKIFDLLAKAECINNKIMYIFAILIILAIRYLSAKIIGMDYEIAAFKGLCFDFIWAALIIYCIVRIFGDSDNVIRKVLITLGKYSMEIWFFHAIFFSEGSKIYFQKILFYPINPALVLIWCIILCLPIAYVLKKIEGVINKGIIKIKSKVKT